MELINSTFRIVVVVKREVMESGPGIALFPKLVVGTQLFMLMLFFVSYSHVINTPCIYSIF